MSHPNGNQGKRDERIAIARDREAEVLRLRTVEHLDFQEIADRVGYADHAGARQALKRALARKVDQDIESFRYAEEVKLDRWERRLEEVFYADHVMAQYGKVVHGDDGLPLIDHGPTMTAAARLLSLAERRSRLRGGDAPLRKILNVVTDDVVQREIERIGALADGIEAELQAER